MRRAVALCGHTEVVATYTLIAEGSWPVPRQRREPDVGEMFVMFRDGEQVRSVLAYAPLGEYVGLRRDLERGGMNEEDAERRARAVLRYVAANEARRWAETGCLKHRDGDQALPVPVTVDLPSHRTLARSPELPMYEPGDQIGEAFDVDD